MRANSFEQKYNAFENIAKKKIDRSKGIFLMGKEVLKFIYMLNRDFESDRGLIPNIGMGELALCFRKSRCLFGICRNERSNQRIRSW